MHSRSLLSAAITSSLLSLGAPVGTTAGCALLKIDRLPPNQCPSNGSDLNFANSVRIEFVISARLWIARAQFVDFRRPQTRVTEMQELPSSAGTRDNGAGNGAARIELAGISPFIRF